MKRERPLSTHLHRHFYGASDSLPVPRIPHMQ
jgi:hypothetical protein